MKKSVNRRIIILILTLIIIAPVFSQGSVKVDETPHDIAYYRETRITKPLVKALYGRPSNNGNKDVFGTQVPFNELWRTGANEATEIRFYNKVVFGDTVIEAGTYVLYTIPNMQEWEVIISSNTDVIGAFQYDAMFDVARTTVPVRKGENIETFAISFRKQERNKIVMTLGWGTTRVHVPLGFSTDEDYASIHDVLGKKKIIN